MAATTLADHDDYRITLHQHGEALTDRIVITFGGQPSDLAAEGFGTSFIKGLGYDTIYVAQRHGTQFQGLTVDTFFDAVASTCADRDVVCYGSSLGAYAALYYGGSIDARIIAGAPMLPAWRPLGHKKYADLAITHVNLADTPLSSKSPVVIYDSMRKQDAQVVDEMVLPAYPSARLVKVPHGGHTVLATLSEALILKPLIISIIEHDQVMSFDPPAEGTATWHAERAQTIAQSDPITAIAEFEKSLTIKPKSQPFCQLLNVLVRQGDLTEVQKRIDAARNQPTLKIVPHLKQKLEALGLQM
ncbi:hypothetical protein [Paracoccus fontiphilus]|uniref:Alpha/beta hydrolase n=1 Tax=Paracoccus fontiphilus TaxID=1815556 RepID=A0ABV7IIA5_9RHOB|nr:hypothetical protein [Paracoccus fontiphilus]